jgi:hypothetical protein
MGTKDIDGGFGFSARAVHAEDLIWDIGRALDAAGI